MKASAWMATAKLAQVCMVRALVTVGASSSLRVGWSHWFDGPARPGHG
jgi:hypothetical protein